MKTALFSTSVLLLALTTAQAQQQVDPDRVAHTTASVADTLQTAKEPVPDTMPEFPGGEHGMLMFLAGNVRYPADAVRARKQGIVLLSFIVKADGTITDIKVLNSLGKDLDEESIRVVKRMPKWKPAMSNNVPVASSYILPVSYRIQQSPLQQGY